ncbi:MAG: hypothetical protein ABI550_08465, partial [Ignavibacteriaceae bacterium]
MGVKKLVFGSNSERKNFEKLCINWSKNYKIYHNLPFLNIFDLNNIKNCCDYNNPKNIILNDVEISRLKKTSVDYTLCNMKDEPILCIEFDGLQQGFNVGTKYIINNNERYRGDIWRREITELKLKVAHGSLFPFFVLGSKHFECLSKQYKLTIVDGIIGEVFTNKAFRKRVNLGFNTTEVGYS